MTTITVDQTDHPLPRAAEPSDDSPFSIKGRLSRLIFAAWMILATVTFSFFEIVITLLPGSVLTGLLTILIAFALIAVSTIFAVRRCHDLDKQGANILALLLPVVNVIFLLYLLLKPGNLSSNRYGEQRDTPTWEKVAGAIGEVLMATPAIIGLGALSVWVIDHFARLFLTLLG